MFKRPRQQRLARRTGAFLATLALFLTVPPSASADHGRWITELDVDDAGGSTYSVRAWSACSENYCSSAYAAARDGAYFYGRTCTYCRGTFSPYRVVPAGRRAHRHVMVSWDKSHRMGWTEYTPLS